MLSRTKARHHVVVAYLALFVALGGSAVAAKPLIDGADVQDESLTSADIQNNSLTGADVEDNSLKNLDIDESSLGEVPNAAKAGIRNRQVVYKASEGNSNFSQFAVAECSAGKSVVGGGSYLHGNTKGVHVTVSTVGGASNDQSSQSWYVSAEEDTPQDGNWQVISYAICVD